MVIEKRYKESFSIIGRRKWVEKGSGVQDVWEDANCHFDDVLPLAKKDEEGRLVGVWGAMSDRTMAFKPWENHFSEGYYLAGIECEASQLPPEGWFKWTLPSFEYLVCKPEPSYAEAMAFVLQTYMPEHRMNLQGAIQEFYDPKQGGQLFLLFPIAKP